MSAYLYLLTLTGHALMDRAAKAIYRIKIEPAQRLLVVVMNGGEHALAHDADGHAIYTVKRQIPGGVEIQNLAILIKAKYGDHVSVGLQTVPLSEGKTLPVLEL